jgi:hypothetical protein
LDYLRKVLVFASIFERNSGRERAIYNFLHVGGFKNKYLVVTAKFRMEIRLEIDCDRQEFLRDRLQLNWVVAISKQSARLMYQVTLRLLIDE